MWDEGFFCRVRSIVGKNLSITVSRDIRRVSINAQDVPVEQDDFLFVIDFHIKHLGKVYVW